VCGPGAAPGQRVSLPGNPRAEVVINAALAQVGRLYELRWPSPAQNGALGTCHALDVPLLFGTFHSPSGRILLGNEEPSAQALTVAGEIRRAWTAFTTHGDPGWPPYQTNQRLTRLLDANPTTAPYPEEPSRRIWQGHHLNPFDLP
jgi:para-nitrobenzyl esterase